MCKNKVPGYRGSFLRKRKEKHLVRQKIFDELAASTFWGFLHIKID